MLKLDVHSVLGWYVLSHVDILVDILTVLLS
jgi:hypothetical protein